MMAYAEKFKLMKFNTLSGMTKVDGNNQGMRVNEQA